MLVTPTLIFTLASIFLAALVRGFSGFGFSMISIMLLSLVLPPVKVVPIILILEIAASIWLLPKVWKDIHWQSLLWLSVGVVVTTPMGAYLLAVVPETPMRVGIALAVLVSAILLKQGFTFESMPNIGSTVLIGMATGLMNGAAALGGPPVILFYLSSPAGIGVSRASLIAYFLFTDTLAIGVNAAIGVVTTDSVSFGAAMLVPLIAGLVLGSRFFIRAELETARRVVLTLLIILSFAGMVRALI